MQSIVTVDNVGTEYDRAVPKLWNETIEAHRREVRTAIQDTTAALVFEHGLRAVTMSQVADETGIGRATLYKYFPDVDTILRAWHSRQVSEHLRHLGEVRDRIETAGKRLRAVLTAYAHIVRQSGSHDTELVNFLHPGDQTADTRQQLHRMIRDLIANAAHNGDLRDDVAPAELAAYCLHALATAGTLTSQAAVDRLITVTLDGLQHRGNPTANG